MSTVSTLLDYVKDDIKDTSSDRNAEIIRYMNRVIRKSILPTLIRFRSDIGTTEWVTAELTENLRTVSLPSDFKTMQVLYCINSQHDGTAASGTATTITLDIDASSSDDNYNSYLIRITGGTGEDQQKTITDYVGSTVTATVDSAWTTNPSSDSTFIVFKEPSTGDELVQRDAGYVRTHYNSIGSVEAYAVEGSNIVLGGIPDDTVRVLWGWYYALPTTLSATTDTIPYSGHFDDVIIEYCTTRALNRDEYNTQMEINLMQQAIDGVLGVITYRQSRTDRQPEYKGSKDL